MSHTNSTSNYNLPQFIGTDKPTWLTDVNGAMSAIDTQMKSNADSATTAGTNASSALSGIGTLGNLTTSEKTNLVGAVNEVNSNLATTASTASSAGINASNAIDGVNALKTYLTMTQFKDLTPTSSSPYLSLSYSSLKSAVNADGSLGRIYGKVDLTGTGTATVTISLGDTNFRPTTAFSVTGFVYAILNTSGVQAQYFSDLTLNFATDGTVTITGLGSYAGLSGRLFFQTGLIFAQDFGD